MEDSSKVVHKAERAELKVNCFKKIEFSLAIIIFCAENIREKKISTIQMFINDPTIRTISANFWTVENKIYFKFNDVIQNHSSYKLNALN